MCFLNTLFRFIPCVCCYNELHSSLLWRLSTRINYYFWPYSVVQDYNFRCLHYLLLKNFNWPGWVNTAFLPIPILKLGVCAVRFSPDIELVVDVWKWAFLSITFRHLHLLHPAQVPGVKSRAEHHIPNAGLHDQSSGLRSLHKHAAPRQSLTNTPHIYCSHLVDIERTLQILKLRL